MLVSERKHPMIEAIKEKTAMVAITMLTAFFISSCSKVNENDKASSPNSLNYIILNDEQIRRAIFGKFVTDEKNGPYEEGIFFYKNGLLYILNSSGTNHSVYKIKDGFLCFKDFTTICNIFVVNNGVLKKVYFLDKNRLGFEVAIKLSKIRTEYGEHSSEQ